MFEISGFAEFYRFYLSEHRHPSNRRMHFIGTLGATVALAAALLLLNPWFIPAGLVFGCGCGCAWLGHFRYEHNKPATFRYPLYSLMADWVMFKDILSGRLSMRQ